MLPKQSRLWKTLRHAGDAAGVSMTGCTLAPLKRQTSQNYSRTTLLILLDLRVASQFSRPNLHNPAVANLRCSKIRLCVYPTDLARLTAWSKAKPTSPGACASEPKVIGIPCSNIRATNAGLG